MIVPVPQGWRVVCLQEKEGLHSCTHLLCPRPEPMGDKEIWQMGLGIQHQLYHFIVKIRHYFANKGLYSQSYGFSSSHVWM